MQAVDRKQGIDKCWPYVAIMVKCTGYFTSVTSDFHDAVDVVTLPLTSWKVYITITTMAALHIILLPQS